MKMMIFDHFWSDCVALTLAAWGSTLDVRI